MKKYVMRYKEAAEDSLSGWETQSLPIGNGYFGASVFGGVICAVNLNFSLASFIDFLR